MHYSFADLAAQADDSGRVRVTISRDETVPIPGTTKRHLAGPGWAEYVFRDNGASVELADYRGTPVFKAQPRN